MSETTEQDIATLLTIDGKGKKAKEEALERLVGEDKKLLSEILEVFETRAKGHAIMYSDRVIHFIPRIKASLK